MQYAQDEIDVGLDMIHSEGRDYIKAPLDFWMDLAELI